MTNIEYLFRFRDLIDKETLARHREIIVANGSCWWGWWQRPNEDPRLDRWAELKSKLDNGPVQIGLFNSDPEKPRGEIHLATLKAVMPPSAGGSAPVLSDKESVLVPEYYRETAFSSAWLRLTQIEERPIDPAEFYGKYSFSKPPALRGISASDLDKYTNKQVIDAGELRSMDATIWEVRPYREGDGSERILAASSKVTEALSSDPIPLRSGLVLHLSDLHFTTAGKFRKQHRWQLIGEGPNPLHSLVVQALRNKGINELVGLVVISGDLTYLASDAEFYEAFRFVHALLGALRLGPEHLVVIPGNHDIAWTKKHGDVWDGSLAVEEAKAEANRAYREAFYERVFRHSASENLSMARRFVLPNGLVLEVGALNTSSLETGKNWLAGMGRIADGAFDDMQSRLGWQATGPSLRLLTLHHHVGAVEDVMPTSEYGTGFGMAADARQTLRKAAAHGVQLVLHGHRHLPFLSFEQVYAGLDADRDRWNLGRVAVVGAGSAGSTEVADNSNYFNLIDFGPTQIELTMFRARSPQNTRGGFEPLRPWTSKLAWDDGRLILADWERKNADA